jgi:hypothetical protein
VLIVLIVLKGFALTQSRYYAKISEAHYQFSFRRRCARSIPPPATIAFNDLDIQG